MVPSTVERQPTFGSPALLSHIARNNLHLSRSGPGRPSESMADHKSGIWATAFQYQPMSRLPPDTLENYAFFPVSRVDPTGFVHFKQQRLSIGLGGGGRSAGPWMFTRNDVSSRP